MRDLKKMADEIVVLETPVNFQAVALAYQHWTDVTYREAVKLLEAWHASNDAPETACNFE